MSRQVVARASEVVPGTSKIVTVKGRDIGIFNIDGSYFSNYGRVQFAYSPSFGKYHEIHAIAGRQFA